MNHFDRQKNKQTQADRQRQREHTQLLFVAKQNQTKIKQNKKKVKKQKTTHTHTHTHTNKQTNITTTTKGQSEQVPPRFELGSLDSESRVLTITPWNRMTLQAPCCCQQDNPCNDAFRVYKLTQRYNSICLNLTLQCVLEPVGA